MPIGASSIVGDSGDVKIMQSVSCTDIRELMGQGGQLVDVRTPMEFYQGALPGAVNIPLQAIDRAPDMLDRSKPVLVYCRSGQRSANARLWLHGMGYDTVLDLGTPRLFAQCLQRAQEDDRVRAPVGYASAPL